MTTNVSGFRITPFLARIDGTEWRPSEREVAEVLEVPVDELPHAHFDEEPHPYYLIGEHRLWGASYRIVSALLPRLSSLLGRTSDAGN